MMALAPQGVLQVPRIVLGLTYVLFVPGYFLTQIVFPRVGQIDTVERLGLSFVLSLACVAGLSLLLDRTVGLHPEDVVIGNLLATVALVAISLRVRSRLEPVAVSGPRRAWRWPSVISDRGLAVLPLLGVLLIRAMLPGPSTLPTFAHSGSNQPDTEFYVTGPTGRLADFPYGAKQGEVVSVAAGVTNRSESDAIYHIEAWSTEPDGGHQRLLAETKSFVVPGQATEDQTISWVMSETGRSRVDLLLFLGSETSAFRHLTLFLDGAD